MKAQPGIGVALLGMGVVGGGVARALLCDPQSMARKIGCPMELLHVLVRDSARQRAGEAPPGLLTDDPQKALTDPRVAVVVELLGGEEPARTYISQALSAGRHVVTANKEVMAKYGPQLMNEARQHGVCLRFEASVAGGIPIIAPLTRDLLANDITSIHAIINGTTNYILTRMARDRVDFDEALQEAQARGYAEADPSSDVEGADAAYKLAILASLAFRTPVNINDVYREGITRLQAQDFRYAQELGYAIKLLAVAARDGDKVQARVHPCFIPQDNILAKVDGAFNAVEVEGDLIDRVVFHGPGAGREPTTSAVIADLIEVGKTIRSGQPAPEFPDSDRRLEVADLSSLVDRYYLRLWIADRPGVLAQIAQVLGEMDISIASVLQKDSDPATGTAEIVITTHPARESAVQGSLSMLEGLEVVSSVRNMIRIEEWSSPG